MPPAARTAISLNDSVPVPILGDREFDPGPFRPPARAVTHISLASAAGIEDVS